VNYDPVDSEGEALAERIRRDIYLRSAGDLSQWQAVWSLEKRLVIRFHDFQNALKYAVTAGWIEAIGDPITSVRLRPTNLTPAADDPSAKGS
jgi:hypothetical protein